MPVKKLTNPTRKAEARVGRAPEQFDKSEKNKPLATYYVEIYMTYVVPGSEGF